MENMEFPKMYDRNSGFYERCPDGVLRPTEVYSELIPALRRGEMTIQPDDLFVTSAPKSGTQWLWDTAVLIKCHGDEKKFAGVKRTLPLEIFHGETPASKIQQVNNVTGMRVFQTHLRPDELPPEITDGKCKTIYVMRNPKDVSVSSFHFHRANLSLGQIKDWTFSQFFPYYYSGNLHFGSWFDQVFAWWKLRHDHPNILFIKYEDMKKDNRGGIKRIAKFLDVELTDDEIEKILELSGFQKTRKRFDDNLGSMLQKLKVEHREGPPPFDLTVSHFIRKGEIGDWKNHFTVAESEAFDKLYQEKMAGSELKFDFE